MKEKMELRLINSELTGSEEGLKVSGYVNKTNQLSGQMGTRKKFVERILPGTFRKALQNGNDIHFYAEHDPNKILASTRNGSLELREDEQGLFMEATISPTSWGKDYHTLIKDGIIRNMSFGMKVLNDSWKKLSDGTYERSISDIYLGEVSAVRNPAYVQSTIEARSIEVVEDEVPEEAEKQEEKRELTLEQEIEAKRSYLKSYEKLALFDEDDEEIKNKISIIKGEIRQMEATLKPQTEPKQELEKREEFNSANTLKVAFPTEMSTSVLKNVNELGFLKHVQLKVFPYSKGPVAQEMFIEQEVQPAVFNPQTDAEYDAVNHVVGYEKVTFNPKPALTRHTVSKQLDNETGMIDNSIGAGATKASDILIESQVLKDGLAESGEQGLQAIAKASDVDVKNVTFTGFTDADGDHGVIDAEDVKLAIRAVTKGFTTAKQPIVIFDKSVQDVLDGQGKSIFNDDDKVFNKETFFADLGTNNLGSKTACIVLHPDAYGVVMSTIKSTKVTGDTSNATEGTITYIDRFYVDAKVLNHKAVKVLGYSAVTPVGKTSNELLDEAVITVKSISFTEDTTVNATTNVATLQTTVDGLALDPAITAVASENGTNYIVTLSADGATSDRLVTIASVTTTVA